MKGDRQQRFHCIFFNKRWQKKQKNKKLIIKLPKYSEYLGSVLMATCSHMYLKASFACSTHVPLCDSVAW